MKYTVRGPTLHGYDYITIYRLVWSRRSAGAAAPGGDLLCAALFTGITTIIGWGGRSVAVANDK